MHGIEFMSVLARASEHAGAIPIEADLHPSSLMIVSKISTLETLIKGEIAEWRKWLWKAKRLQRLQKSRRKPLKPQLRKRARSQSPLWLGPKRRSPWRKNVLSGPRPLHSPLWTLLYKVKSDAASRRQDRSLSNGAAN